MIASDSYGVLAAQLGFPNSERLRLVLEYLMTPEAARMVEALPGTVSEVAEKTGYDVDMVREELSSLFYKGVAIPRGDFNHREYYRFARRIGQFHDATLATGDLDPVKDRKFFELWHDFTMNEMYPSFAKNHQARGVPIERIVPAYKSIEGLPEVLPYEDYREIIRAQERVAVVKCTCRYRTTAVGEHCQHTSEEDRWNCLQFGRGAEYAIVRGSGKGLSTEEAIDLIGQMEEDGLLHMWPNHASMTGINVSCNCCRDCCLNYVPIDQAGLSISLVWEKSRFAAFVASADACNGCQDCVDRCQFDAIEMARVGNSRRLKPVVVEENCFGCGVCVVGCALGALKMKTVRPPEHIPATAAPAH